MQIRYLNGIRLKRAIIAGSNSVISNREYLNKINVFPVADSDTGTNMASTLQNMMNGLVTCMDHSVDKISRVAADAALMGARGNSGAILAQFLHGLAEEFSDNITVSTKSFGAAVSNAVDYAYDAISNPREGTILTVIREWAHHVHEKAQHTDDFVEVLRESIGAAKDSLSHTPDHLHVLKQAGVVDAGARGFVDLLEGMANFIKRGKIRELKQLQVEIQETGPNITDEMGEIAFQFCTECIIEGTDIDHKDLRSALSDMGDSLIIAGSRTKTKVHVHTNDPRQVFRIAEKWGKITGEKADDMRDQFRSAHTKHGDIALVVDTACDMPRDLVERFNIQMVPLRVLFGDKTYVDKLSLTPDDFYQMMRNNPDTHPSTSQPTPADFLNKFEFLSSHYDNVLCLSLSGGLSGTYQSAMTAVRNGEFDANIEIIDTKNLTVGAALIVRKVAEAIEDGASIEEATSLAKSLVPRTKLLVAVPSLESLIRGGRVSKMKGLIANLLNLKPVIRIDEDGKAEQFGTVFGVEGGKKKIFKLLQERLDSSVPLDFAIAHVDAMDDAKSFAERIENEFTLNHDIFIQDASPVLAAHAGFGVVAIAYIEPAGAE
ncbi:MAG: DegV family EDD domain-containing protein [Candidatus Marinimicrobia bacterium]|nr:DegV family EDD domain-containing protein [Candidatus Neomarinimicrobiota bacterium]MCF7827857.1 DegV family EDD domain-containing protein [Candidatus Neomarinimicrobiota bacterium]MCF7879388.1 DegV family EDD domain-containing protein [Candidatus Neomarinimicrobiota bacterium]